MDVTRLDKEFRGEIIGQGIEVVNPDAVFLHNAGGDFIVLVVIACLAPILPFRDGGSMGPDQFGLGLLQAGGQLFQILLILLKGCREGSAFLVAAPLRLGLRMTVAKIPQPPVEMNDVPLRFTDPAIEHLQARTGVLGIATMMDDFDLPLQGSHDVRGVANRNGIPDEQSLGQILGP